MQGPNLRFEIVHVRFSVKPTHLESFNFFSLQTLESLIPHQFSIRSIKIVDN